MLNCINSHGALRGPQPCSTLLGCSVSAAAHTDRCHARSPIARLPSKNRSRLVSKADRRDRQPRTETPQSIIDLIAEEAAPPVEPSLGPLQFRPSSLEPLQQQEYIDNYVAKEVEKERVLRKKGRQHERLYQYKKMRLKDKGIYLEAKDREWEINDFVDFPCDMWQQDERNEREPYDEYEWEDYELRAWVEKRRHYAQMGREWDQARSELNRGTVGQVGEYNDVRLMPKDGQPAKRWSHEDIWNLITENGNNYNPSDDTMIIFKPDIKCDYFSEAIVYKDEMVEMLEKEGRLWEEDVEPDMMKEISIAADADFADLGGSNVGDGAGEQEVPETLDSETETGPSPGGQNQVESLEQVVETGEDDFEMVDDDDDE